VDIRNGYSQGLGNANKIMNRLLFDGFDNNFADLEIKAGVCNAIPRESQAKVIIAEVYDEALFF
jgi:dipeptidase D